MRPSRKPQNVDHFAKNSNSEGLRVLRERFMHSIALYSPSFWASQGFQLPAHTLAVVIDVLRATSTMVTAFSNGVQRINPVSSVESAFLIQRNSSSIKLAGEKGGIKIEGFDFGNSPQEFLHSHSIAYELVMFTTNGTKAFLATQSAQEVIAASFLNLESVVEKVAHWQGPVAYFCAGTGADFSLEDAIVAGAILDRVDPLHTLASLYRFTKNDLPSVFRQSINGRNLLKIGLESDIDFCLQINRFPVLPYFDFTQGVIDCFMKQSSMGQS